MAASAPTLLSRPHRVVGVGDLAVCDDAQLILSTYALGSCIGVVAYEPLLKVGGILHLMLPDSSLSPAKAAATPAVFADTGLPRFFSLLAGRGARAPRLELLLAGGANVIQGHDPFCIGERNLRATVDFLSRHGHAVRHSEVGGSVNRTVHLGIASGLVTVKTPAGEQQFCLNG
jgi:chemotaxis protein CheD